MMEDESSYQDQTAKTFEQIDSSTNTASTSLQEFSNLSPQDVRNMQEAPKKVFALSSILD